jgi:hypothetical protein
MEHLKHANNLLIETIVLPRNLNELNKALP